MPYDDWLKKNIQKRRCLFCSCEVGVTWFYLWTKYAQNCFSFFC